MEHVQELMKYDESHGMEPDSTLEIGGEEAVNYYTCYEGCIDSYYIHHGDYLWTINFYNGLDAQSKEEFDGGIYGESVKEFLDSIEFIGDQLITYPE